MNNTSGIACGSGTTYLPKHLSSTSLALSRVRGVKYVVFCIVFCGPWLRFSSFCPLDITILSAFRRFRDDYECSRYIVSSSPGPVKRKTIKLHLLLRHQSTWRLEIKAKTGWHWIRIMCPSEVICLSADSCLFESVSTININKGCWSSIKPIFKTI